MGFTKRFIVDFVIFQKGGMRHYNVLSHDFEIRMFRVTSSGNMLLLRQNRSLQHFGWQCKPSFLFIGKCSKTHRRPTNAECMHLSTKHAIIMQHYFTSLHLEDFPGVWFYGRQVSLSRTSIHTVLNQLLGIP